MLNDRCGLRLTRKKPSESGAAALDSINTAVWRHESGSWAGPDDRREARTSRRFGEGLKLDLEAEPLELGDETLGFEVERLSKWPRLPHNRKYCTL
jgi:hypothetical protein